jgi:DNA replication licensing factor MCM4
VQHGLRTDAIRSSSSNLFVRSSMSDSARNRRSDIHSDVLGSTTARRRRLFVDENGVAHGSGEDRSDAATFSNLDPNTSDADALGGGSARFIWGTDVSLMDTMSTMKDFLLNFQKKYRMVQDGELEPSASLPQDHAGNTKEYVEMMKSMLELGVTALNLDARNLKAYPPTKKLWYQLQGFPSEIVPIMDLTIRDVMIDLAETRVKELVAQRQLQLQQTQSQTQTQTQTQTQSTSAGRHLLATPPRPRSDLTSEGPQTDGTQTALPEIPDLVRETEGKTYRVRPFGLDKAINLRDLNPGGMYHEIIALYLY